ncbi:MAG: right-handed parallel beta-helix repeat-containing protein, partial [Planctomycetota bacterium]
MRYVYALICCIILSSAGFGDTLSVPDQYSSIQAAINKASNGDIILVSPGTYAENIDFLGKNLEVISTAGPESTIIDGGTPSDPNQGAVVTFTNGEGPSCKLEGFTLTNGTGNMSSGSLRGAGVYCRESSPQLINLIVTNNHASFGGAMYIKYYASPFVYRCRIYGNSATQEGGAFRIYGSTPLIVSTTVSNNTANMGGGIHAAKCTEWPRLYNSTVCDNTATVNGGGFFIRCDAPVQIANCIIYGNHAQSGPQIYLSDSPDGLYPTISYSDVENGKNGVFYHAMSTIHWEEGMIASDPMFTLAENGYYSLGAGSPCINSGTNDHAAKSGKDVEGDPRIYNAIVDLGADEFTAFALALDSASIQAGIGGKINYQLDAGMENANRLYLILGSLSGTEPGFNGLPGGYI